jgi:hypothetical protein
VVWKDREVGIDVTMDEAPLGLSDAGSVPFCRRFPPAMREPGRANRGGPFAAERRAATTPVAERIIGVGQIRHTAP